MTITREDILSALVGYIIWLFILAYYLVYRPVQKLVEVIYEQ